MLPECRLATWSITLTAALCHSTCLAHNSVADSAKHMASLLELALELQLS